MTEMRCPFCKKQVKAEYYSLTGCKECVKEWTTNMNVEHDID